MIGVTAGTGYYKVMIVSTVMAIVILTVCGKLDDVLRRETQGEPGNISRRER